MKGKNHHHRDGVDGYRIGMQSLTLGTRYAPRVIDFVV